MLPLAATIVTPRAYALWTADARAADTSWPPRLMFTTSMPWVAAQSSAAMSPL